MAVTDDQALLLMGRVGRHTAQGLAVPKPRGAAAVPALVGNHVTLRPVEQGDYPFLIELQTAPENLIRWRYRGVTPSPEQIIQGLWQGVLAQFLILRVETAEPVGLVIAYNPEFRHGYAYIATIVTPRYEMSGWTFEADALFLSYLFETFGFHKIYFEMIEFNYHKLASGAGSIFHVEGCFGDHEYHLGQRLNLYTLAIYREEWRGTLTRLAPYLADQPDAVNP